MSGTPENGRAAEAPTPFEATCGALVRDRTGRANKRHGVFPHVECQSLWLTCEALSDSCRLEAATICSGVHEFVLARGAHRRGEDEEKDAEAVEGAFFHHVAWRECQYSRKCRRENCLLIEPISFFD